MLGKVCFGLSLMSTLASYAFCELHLYVRNLDVKVTGERYEVPISIASHRPELPSFIEEKQHLASEIKRAYKLNAQRASNFSEWILFASIYSDVPYQLLTGVIMTESSFRYEAISSVGALGPAQIRPKFWQDFCSSLNLSNPKQNIECSGRILRRYYDKYCESDWGCAIGLYNVGPTNFRKSSYYRAASIRYRKKVANHADMISIPESFNQGFDTYAALF
ncbi:transglycosylase SLT domain-containing protein [Vibrio owensii]|uniref:transglycosylase SLT domain-containing protein n=1 Tax=Vibrio harveyi group TaxID=717610 RepID=UPI003CC533B6